MGRGALAPQRSAPAFFFSASCKSPHSESNVITRTGRAHLARGACFVPERKKEERQARTRCRSHCARWENLAVRRAVEPFGALNCGGQSCRIGSAGRYCG